MGNVKLDNLGNVAVFTVKQTHVKKIMIIITVIIIQLSTIKIILTKPK